MIDSITISNFKCFDSITVRLPALSLLTGFNAAGKSTILQCILLLAQALRSNAAVPEIALNGPLTQLGRPGDVLKKGVGNTEFIIKSGKNGITWCLDADDRLEGRSLRISGINLIDGRNVKKYRNFKKIYSLCPLKAGREEIGPIISTLKQVVYLSAVRAESADAFPIPEVVSAVNADVGILGEYAPWLFHKYMDDEIDINRANKKDSSLVLRRQIKAWASELFPDSDINAIGIENTNLMRLEFRVGETSDWCRPANIGYGLSYAFPILVAGLLAKPGQVLIIDSPEAHLHPMGQSKMGDFLAVVSSAGVQVIVETHSDHILNGVRLAALRKTDSFDRKDVAFHFFARDADNIIHHEIEITQSGGLSEYPAFFFDQSEKDLRSIVEARKSRK